MYICGISISASPSTSSAPAPLGGVLEDSAVSVASAPGNEDAVYGPSTGKSVDGGGEEGSTEDESEVTTTLMRLRRGRNLGGMEAHVFLPMITAFILFFSAASPPFPAPIRAASSRGDASSAARWLDPLRGSVTSLVTRLKKAISPLSIGHGKLPARPMPR